MFDVNFSEMMVIAVVAFIVIGPERLPKVARTLGHLLGRGQRYISSVKADMERDFAIEELRKLQEKVQEDYKAAEGAVSQVTQTLNMHAQDFTQSVTQQVEQVREGINQQSQINLDLQSSAQGASGQDLFPKADPNDYVLQPLNQEPTEEEIEFKAVALSYQEATRNLYAQQEEARKLRIEQEKQRVEEEKLRKLQEKGDQQTLSNNQSVLQNSSEQQAQAQVQSAGNPSQPASVQPAQPELQVTTEQKKFPID